MKGRHIVLVGLAVSAAACSSASSTGTTATTTSTTASTTTSTTMVSRAAAGSQFLAAAIVAEEAYFTWRAELVGVTKISQAVKPCATYAAVLSTFDNAVLQIDATGKTEADIQTLVADDHVVISDLLAVPTETVSTLLQEKVELRAAGRAAIRAGDVVRHDFGLPSS
ncbi:MAG: hypothetical protein ABR925_08685 [Acidimicrobiales bacterium]|jgi:hypothetical protein